MKVTDWVWNRKHDAWTNQLRSIHDHPVHPASLLNPNVERYIHYRFQHSNSSIHSQVQTLVDPHISQELRFLGDNKYSVQNVETNLADRIQLAGIQASSETKPKARKRNASSSQNAKPMWNYPKKNSSQPHHEGKIFPSDR